MLESRPHKLDGVRAAAEKQHLTPGPLHIRRVTSQASPNCTAKPSLLRKFQLPWDAEASIGAKDEPDALRTQLLTCTPAAG
eukprot:16257-Prymnesium_polylepis.1